MRAIFDLLYREYCRARLTEMRIQLSTEAESQEVPQTNCFARHPDGVAGRGSDLRDWQREAGQCQERGA